MSESLFRVGGHYRDVSGDIVALCAEGNRVGAKFLDGDHWRHHGGYFDLNTGECRLYRWCSLQPGELTFVNGEWLPVTPTLDKLEAEMPQRAETLGDLLRKALDRTFTRPSMTHVADVPDGLQVTHADLAMIARDGPARVQIPKPQQLTVLVQSTAKPALQALTRMSEAGYRLGAFHQQAA